MQRVDELRAEFRERCALNVEYVQALLLPIVECNVLDCFEQGTAEPAATAQRKRRSKTTTAPPSMSRGVRFKPLDRLRREQGLAIAGLKLGDDGAVVDVKFHSKNEAAVRLYGVYPSESGRRDGNIVSIGLTFIF